MSHNVVSVMTQNILDSEKCLTLSLEIASVSDYRCPLQWGDSDIDVSLKMMSVFDNDECL